MNKTEALKKIEELKSFVESCDQQEEWVKIDYSVIPKEVFDMYGAKPFEIMKKKMRKDGKVWNNISWLDAKKETKKLGFRLLSIQEILVLLHVYKQKFSDDADIRHNEFLGIEELSYDETVYYEWIDAPVPASRGGCWGTGSSAGAFTLDLGLSSGSTHGSVGFRCAR